MFVEYWTLFDVIEYRLYVDVGALYIDFFRNVERVLL